MAAIPTVNDDAERFYNAANSGRLDKYGEFVFIDNIAKNYSYTHDQAGELSWSTLMTLVSYNREQSYVESVANKMMNESNK